MEKGIWMGFHFENIAAILWGSFTLIHIQVSFFSSVGFSFIFYFGYPFAVM